MITAPNISLAVDVVVAYRRGDDLFDNRVDELVAEFGVSSERFLIEALCSLVNVTAGVLARREQVTCNEVLQSISTLACAVDNSQW